MVPERADRTLSPSDTGAGRTRATVPAEAGVPAADPAPDVHRIPTDIPFPLAPANATWFAGAVPTLVDCGCRTEAGWASLKKGAEARGIDLASVEQVLITHAHLDHAGNARRLAEETGAQVYIHADDAGVLRHWEDILPERNASYDAGLVRAGLPDRLLLRFAERGREVDAMMQAVPEAIAVRDGDVLPAGDRELTVLHTPGHTPGSAVFWDREGGLSVTGDTVLERITPNALQVRKEEDGALATYLDTLRRLRDLPLGTMVPGHGPCFEGLPAIVDRAVRLYEERRGRVLGYLRAATGPMTVWDIVDLEWPEIHPGRAFLAVSEILGHLGILAEEDAIEVTEPEARPDGGTAAWFRLR